MITTQSFLSSHYVQRRSPFAVQTTSVFKTALCVPHRRSVLNRRLSCVKTEGISILLHSSLSSCVISVQQCRKSTIEKCPPDYFKCSSMTCAPTKELCPNTMVTTSPFSLQFSRFVFLHPSTAMMVVVEHSMKHNATSILETPMTSITVFLLWKRTMLYSTLSYHQNDLVLSMHL